MKKDGNSFLEKNWYLIIGVLAIISTITISGLTTSINGNSPHDDYLLLRVAASILEGEWLGSYDSYIMAKYPSYPLFLVLCNKMSIPYLTGLAVYHSLSCVYFSSVLKKIINNKWIVISGYAYLLFSPSMFSNYTIKLYRMGVVLPSVILLLSALINMYVQRYSKNSVLVKSALVAGGALSFFWYIREDSIWILPFVIGALVCIIICILRKAYANKKIMGKITLIKKIGVVTIPIICLLLVTNILCLKNYMEYGIYATSDYNGTYYAKVVSQIKSIEQDKIPYVYVNYDTVQKIYEVSPTFASIRDEIESMYEGAWQSFGTEEGIDDGEIEGGYFFWAMRDAVTQAGYYKDAEITNLFYKEIYKELNEAFESGRLKKEAGFSMTLGGAFNVEKIKEYTVENIQWVVNYEKINISRVMSTPPEDHLDLAETVTGNILLRQLVKPVSETVTVNGWFFACDAKSDMSILVTNNDGIVIEPEIKESMDVYNQFEGEYENSLNARVDFTVESGEETCIEIYKNEKLVEIFPVIEGVPDNIITNDYVIHFDTVKYESIVNLDVTLKENKIRLPNIILRLYQNMSGIITILASISTLFLLYHSIKNKNGQKSGEYILVVLGIMATFFLLNGGVAYAYAEKWNTSDRWVYIMAAHTVLEIYNIMTISIALDVR